MSYTSSKYKTLNRSYFPLTANKNTEDEPQKYPFAILVSQNWKALLELLSSACASGNCLILDECKSAFLWRCLVTPLRLLCRQHASFWKRHTTIGRSELLEPGLPLLHIQLVLLKFWLIPEAERCSSLLFKKGNSVEINKSLLLEIAIRGNPSCSTFLGSFS